jgi:dipeptidyl aminopeptidase/acylaminoacyl peptidase
MYVREEYDPLWLEVRRYLSIRSAKYPRAMKNERAVLFLSDVTGVDSPWIWRDGSVDPLLPLDDRVGGLEVSSSGLVALASDVDGNERWRLEVYDMRSGTLGSIQGDGRTSINNVGAWSSDGLVHAFTSNIRNGVDFDLYLYVHGKGVRGPVAVLEGMNSVSTWISERYVLVVHSNTNLDRDIYLVDVVSGEVRNLTKHEGEADNRSPVPLDSSRFLFLTNADQEFTNIAVYDLGRGDWKYVYRSPRDVEALDVSPGGMYVAFVENYEGFSRLYVSTVDFSEVVLVDAPQGVAADVSWGAAGIAYSVSGPRVGQEVFLANPGSAPRAVTSSPKFGLRMEEMVVPEHVWYESWDGMRIPALIYRPRTGKPPYPAVVIVHGGPESQARPSFDMLAQIFVRLGFLVLLPNFRGSTGYGKTFVHLDDRERRMDSLRDIGALVVWAEERDLLVRGRVAITGASYGGYATLMSLALFPDYWSCGVERVGIVNLVTFIRNTGPWRRKYRIYEYGDPDTMYDVMMALSPITYLDRIRVPLMVVHGRNDPRVPISEAEQLVRRMRELGKEVVYVEIGDEGHGVAKVRNRTSVYAEVIRFIVKHTLSAETG